MSTDAGGLAHVAPARTPSMDGGAQAQNFRPGIASIDVGALPQSFPAAAQMSPPGSQTLSLCPPADPSGQVHISPPMAQTLSWCPPTMDGTGQVQMTPPGSQVLSFCPPPMDPAGQIHSVPNFSQMSPPGTMTLSCPSTPAPMDSTTFAQRFVSGTRTIVSGTASIDAATLSQKFPSGTQAKIVAGALAPRPDLIDQHCVVIGVNGRDASLLMLVTARGGLESLLPENLALVQIQPGSRVVIVDAYHELDAQLVQQTGVLTAFKDNKWSVALDSPKQGMEPCVELNPRNIVSSVSCAPEADNWAGQQAKIRGTGSKPELINQHCVVLGFDATQSQGSQLMVLLASGGLESILPENLVKVPMAPGSRVVIVDAYHELDTQLAFKSGTLAAFQEGLWTVSLDCPIQGMSPSVQISTCNLVLLPDSIVTCGDEHFPEEGPVDPPKTTPASMPSARSAWDRMQTLQDEIRSNSQSDSGDEKENVLQLGQNGEFESPLMQTSADGDATLLHLVCIGRKGLLKDLATALSDVGVDVEQCDIAAPKGLTVVDLRIVDAETAGPIDPERFPEIREVAQAVAEAAAKAGPSKSMRGRRTFRSNSVEFSNLQPASPTSRQQARSQKRILIIGPGFGLELNKEQISNVYQAGFQVKVIFPLNPETPGFNMGFALGEVRAAVDEFQPDMVGAASKGGLYLLALWQTGQWTGPSLLINAHPSCLSLPQNVPIVIAHGSNDKVWPRARADLERLVSTGTRNMCFLYYTANSGRLGAGYTRQGDEHNMQSLLHYDCLPRLIDAVISREPELILMRSWLGQIHADRLAAERWIGYSAEQFQRQWTNTADGQLLVEISPQSDEFQKVATLFRSNPVEPASIPYQDQHLPHWESTGIARIERVQNEMQLQGSFLPYYEQLKAAVESQGIKFEKGVHTRWAFHGTDAVDAIISNPVSGFQPLASGTRSGSIWGPGSYFARDAKYVARAGYATAQPDGTKRMLLCLLTTGLPCLGDPDNHGVLPVRCGQHRYHSSVDSMSNPEVHVIQNPAAAYPAYIITFV